MEYDMQHFLESCVDLYRELIDPKVKWRAAATPFLDESSVDSSRPHADDCWYQCPHCEGRYPESAFTKGKGEN
jgi:hypothetical protein